MWKQLAMYVYVAVAQPWEAWWEGSCSLNYLAGGLAIP